MTGKEPMQGRAIPGLLVQDREPHLWSYRVEGIYIPWSQVQAGGKRWLVLSG